MALEFHLQTHSYFPAALYRHSRLCVRTWQKPGIGIISETLHILCKIISSGLLLSAAHCYPSTHVCSRSCFGAFLHHSPPRLLLIPLRWSSVYSNSVLEPGLALCGTSHWADPQVWSCFWYMPEVLHWLPIRQRIEYRVTLLPCAVSSWNYSDRRGQASPFPSFLCRIS